MPHDPNDLQIDHDRERRCGFPEVVYGSSKTTEQVVQATREIFEASGRAFVTRVDGEVANAIEKALEGARVEHHESARCVTIHRPDLDHETSGAVLVLSAGTSDVPVAEEARVTAWMAGCQVTAHYDVGVAGIHRLLELGDEIACARAIVVVAGMDGALPSVVAGLASCPVIGVPTSVGYGAAFEGLAPLLSMLNSCAAGLAVVNIDAGFSAGMLAARINRNSRETSS